MSCLLGISSNRNQSLSLLFNQTMPGYGRIDLVAYALKNDSPLILKNLPLDTSSSNSDNLLNANKELDGRATILCTYPCPDDSKANGELHPFSAVFRGKTWSFTCQMHLKDDFKIKLPLIGNSSFKVEGQSDEEYVFCWLMQQLDAKSISRLNECPWSMLYEMLQNINSHGGMNLLFCDGESLVAYHGYDSKEALYAVNLTGAHKPKEVHSAVFSISLESSLPADAFVLFANREFEDIPSKMTPMQYGQMLGVLNGTYIWDSHAIFVPAKSTIENEMASIKAAVTLDNLLILSHIRPIPLQAEDDRTSPTYQVISNSDDNPTIYSITHHTTYNYASTVAKSKHLFRLQPHHDLVQNVLYYRLAASVDGKFCNFMGAFGNNATIFDVTQAYDELHVISNAVLAVNVPPPQRYDLLHQQCSFPLVWMPWDQIMMQAYLTPPEIPESQLYELSSYAHTFVKRNHSHILDVLNDINRTIFHDYVYLSGSSTLMTTPFDVYVSKRGVCQDFANLFICLARLLNIPARYRVGYIYTGTDYSNKIQGDASHAWVELYLPNIGWLGFDPTNCCLQSKNHIRVASGRNYRDATPTSGTIYEGGGVEKMKTSVKVVILTPRQLHEFLSNNIS